MNCNTCEHWTSPSKRTDFYSIYIDDTTDVKFGICQLIKLADSRSDTPDIIPLAVTKDGSDYKAILYTQADFGCVLHSDNHKE